MSKGEMTELKKFIVGEIDVLASMLYTMNKRVLLLEKNPPCFHGATHRKTRDIFPVRKSNKRKYKRVNE